MGNRATGHDRRIGKSGPLCRVGDIEQHGYIGNFHPSDQDDFELRPFMESISDRVTTYS